MLTGYHSGLQNNDKLSAMRLVLIAAICSSGTWAQTIPARAKASDYAVNASAGKLTLAADYMVHSLAARGKTFFVNDYLIIETAVFPGGVPVMISSGSAKAGERILEPAFSQP